MAEQDQTIIIYSNGEQYEAPASIIYDPFPEPEEDVAEIT